MTVVYTRGQARLEGWSETLSKQDLVEIIRQQDEVLEERNRLAVPGPTQWTKMSLPLSQPSRDVYTARIGELTAVLTVTHLVDHPEIGAAKIQERSIRFTSTVRSKATYTNAFLADANDSKVFNVEADALENAEHHINHLRRSIGPDIEVAEVAKYLIEELDLKDMVHTVRSRAIAMDYGLPEEEQHQGNSWEHPKVLRFVEILKKIQGWVK